jgi:uncharacterized membrane protein
MDQNNQDPRNEHMPATDRPQTADAPVVDKDIEENKIVAALSYLNILFLIPLFLKRDSKFAQFHAKQGLVMFVVFLVGWVVFWIPIFGWLLWLALVVADIVAIIKALQGRYWEIPVIGEWAKKINL